MTVWSWLKLAVCLWLIRKAAKVTGWLLLAAAAVAAWPVVPADPSPSADDSGGASVTKVRFRVRYGPPAVAALAGNARMSDPKAALAGRTGRSGRGVRASLTTPNRSSLIVSHGRGTGPRTPRNGRLSPESAVSGR